MKRILIVDDHLFVRDALKNSLIEKYELYEAGTGEDALIIQEKLNPEIIILDLCLPDKDGLDLVAEFKRFNKDVLIIILTAYEDANTVKTLSITSDSILFKSRENINSIGNKIEDIATYGRTDTRNYITRLLSSIPLLTQREAEILQLLKKGLSSNQIAQKIFLSINTVNNYRKGILKKLNAGNTYQLLKH